MDTGSGSSHGTKGSVIKPATDALRRRAGVPEYSKVITYADGGQIAIPHSRWQEAMKSKNERKKLASELRTARVYAHAGHRVEFTAHGAANHDVFFDGKPADIKKLSTANNIRRHSNHAIENQGAKIVLFEFTKRSKNTGHELQNSHQKEFMAFISTQKKRKSCHSEKYDGPTKR